jgi:type II secretory pathway pseudopilin PulG
MLRGQALVVVLLILGVIATVGLSVASRSVTEVRVSTTQEESARALEAAEVGLEKYLGGLPTPAPGTKVAVPNINAGYYIPSETTLGDSNSYKVPYPLIEGDVATIDMPGCQASGECTHLKVCWGSDNPAQNRKIEVAYYYVLGGGGAGNQGRVAVRRIGFDPAGDWSGFVTGNSIKTDKKCATDTTFNYEVEMKLSDEKDVQPENLDLALGPFPGGNKLLFVRIRMLGNGATAESLALQITGSANIPRQGGEVVAVGEAGESVQKIRAKVFLWDLPSMFDSAVFSGTSLTSAP